MTQLSQVRVYDRATSVVFFKTKERFGGLSNMAPGFPLRVNDVSIRTSEALYQACRFPLMPDVQRRIIGEYSPMTAKMRGKPYRKESRLDWEKTRVKIMRWCLRVKLAQNGYNFGNLLLATGNRPIVEQSRRDDFWGAKVNENGTLVGMNVLGRLLMELREQLKDHEAESLRFVEPLSIPEFLLFGMPVRTICSDEGVGQTVEIETRSAPLTAPSIYHEVPQSTFFDRPVTTHDEVGVPRDNGATSRDCGQVPRPYPTYRDSGVSWFGDVPEHWDVRRVRNVVDMRVSNVDKHAREGEEPIRLCNYVDVYKNDYIDNRMKFMKATATVDELERFRLEEGDVLITKDSEAWDDIGVPALVTESASDLISGYHLALLRPRTNTIRGSYLLRALQSTSVAHQFHIAATGVTRYGLSHADIKSILVPLPPISEQAAIVRYLDHVAKSIDRYISAKERLISLLNEKKQAIIDRAVTRGLDPSAPMKPTDIDWMPEVPAHWEIVKLKRLARMRSGEEITAETIREIGPYRVYGGNGIRGHTDRFTHDGVFALIGRQGALCGNVHLASGQFWASEHAIVASLKAPNNIRWFVDLLRTMNLNQYSEAAAQPGLAVDHIVNLYIPAPPKDEQEAIARYLSDESNDLDTAIDRARCQIGLLREYRERLISDVVTGKLDVREARAGNGGSS